MRNKILSFRVTAFFCLLCIALLGTVSPAFAQEGKKWHGPYVGNMDLTDNMMLRFLFFRQPGHTPVYVVGNPKGLPKRN